jgi:hypothetical protein
MIGRTEAGALLQMDRGLQAASPSVGGRPLGMLDEARRPAMKRRERRAPVIGKPQKSEPIKPNQTIAMKNLRVQISKTSENRRLIFQKSLIPRVFQLNPALQLVENQYVPGKSC